MTKTAFLAQLASHPSGLAHAVTVRPHRTTGRQLVIETNDRHAAHAIEQLARRAAVRVSTAASYPSEHEFLIVATFDPA